MFNLRKRQRASIHSKQLLLNFLISAGKFDNLAPEIRHGGSQSATVSEALHRALSVHYIYIYYCLFMWIPIFTLTVIVPLTTSGDLYL